jgi:short-subunit dehydrogenase
MSKFNGKIVLITGGASGIGRIMGEMALKKGASALVIWDINQTNIDATICEMKVLGKVVGYRVDVSDYETVASSYAKVKEEVGDVDILINCAGIITSNKTFDLCSADEMDRTIKVNTLAPMYVARQVLPDMIKRNSGHICNIASAGGMLSNPKMSVYAASKWAAIGWSDSVRIELQEMKSQVRVTTIAPYYITTGMFDGVKSKVFPLLNPEKVAQRIIGAIEGDKKMLMLMKWIPFPHHFIRLLQGLLPMRVFDWLLGEVLGIYHTMDNFTGRKS